MLLIDYVYNQSIKILGFLNVNVFENRVFFNKHDRYPIYFIILGAIGLLVVSSGVTMSGWYQSFF